MAALPDSIELVEFLKDRLLWTIQRWPLWLCWFVVLVIQVTIVEVLDRKHPKR